MILSLYGRIRVSGNHIFYAVEAMVKIIKKDLSTITTNYLFKDETFNTYSADIGSIIHCRTLTELSDNINKVEVLTQNNFLTGTANSNLLICSIKKSGDITIKKTSKVIQIALKLFFVTGDLVLIVHKKYFDLTSY